MFNKADKIEITSIPREIRIFFLFLFGYDSPIKVHHLYAVMQVSMSEHVNHTLASDTLFPTASSPASFEF